MDTSTALTYFTAVCITITAVIQVVLLLDSWLWRPHRWHG